MSKVSDEFEFLEYVYKDLQINVENARQIINIGNNINDKIREILNFKIDEYKKCIIAIKKMIERRKQKIEEAGLFNKVATSMSVKLSIKDDETKDDLIDRIIQGSNFIIISINKKFDEYNIMSKHIVNLKNRIINIEENSIKLLEKI